MTIDLEPLRRNGVLICDEFLSTDLYRHICDDFDFKRERGLFRGAYWGTPGQLKEDSDVRGDQILWWEDDTVCAAQTEFLSRVQKIESRMNQEFFLGLRDLEIHYACYPGGSRYEKHFDNPHGANRRVISGVFYLNSNWNSAHGGDLVFSRGERIHPKGNRLVLFLSQEIEHEVEETTVIRKSIVMWFRRDVGGLKSL